MNKQGSRADGCRVVKSVMKQLAYQQHITHIHIQSAQGVQILSRAASARTLNARRDLSRT